MANWIYKIKEIEESVGKLYLMISEKTENLYPEVSELFHQLYKDEVHHSGQVDFISSLFRELEDSFGKCEKTLEILSERIKFIEDITGVIDEKEMYLHPVELLKIAIEIEDELGEGHELISEAITNPELKKLIDSLAIEDRIHSQRIHDFLESYEKGMPVLEDSQK
ncbi:MAG: ferritin family protein [Acidobacteriota bacterium]